MPSKIVHAEKARVLAIFALADAIPDIQTQAHFARYLALTLCGLLELSARTLIAEYSARTSSPKIASYCAVAVKGFTNPNCEKIQDLVGRFSGEWRITAENFFDSNTGAAVDSIKNIRDNVAHGIPHGITLGNVKKYSVEIVKTVEFLETLFDTG